MARLYIVLVIRVLVLSPTVLLFNQLRNQVLQQLKQKAHWLLAVGVSTDHQFQFVCLAFGRKKIWRSFNFG
jgi:hypothetical protein